MYGQKRAAQLVLAVILIAGAVIVSISPLNFRYAPTTWSAVILGAVLALIIWRIPRKHTTHCPQYDLRLARKTINRNRHLSLLYLAILSQIASATTQTLVAIDLPSPHLPLHETPGIGTLYLLLAGVTTFVVVWLALSRGDTGCRWAALVGAGLLSSTLHLRTFDVPEAGPVCTSVFALTLITVSTLPVPDSRFQVSRFTRWGLIFLFTSAITSLFSPVPGLSLDAWLRLACLIGLAIVLSRSTDTVWAWRLAAWGTVGIAGIVPVAVGLLKWLSLLIRFGFWPASAYRWSPNELGGANLVARSVLCVVPLTLALTANISTHAFRWIGWGTLVGSTLLMVYARSWEGFFALLVTLCVYGLLARWNDISAVWQRWSGARATRWTVVTGIATLALILVAASITIAPLLNVSSFNGRLVHWYGATLAWMDHPWIGGGLGNEAIYTPYGKQVRLLVATQVTRDNPLSVIHIDAGRPLKRHAHNLFLEMGARTGTLGFLTFIGLLAVILILGLRTWRQCNGPLRVWTAGCLAGIVGALAWGMLDVLWVTPPFFSFPVWGLVGLLVAAARGSGTAEGRRWTMDRRQQTTDDGRRMTVLVRHWLPVVLAALIVLRPALASARYAAGFLAFQERRWDDAVSALEQTTRYRPLDPRPRQLLAEAYLGQRDAERAALAYRRASALKSGYSPYYSQLGWLAWLRGDVDQATAHFEQAIEIDPGEAWRDGLHADLGLIHASQGRYEEAISMFKKAIELHPQMAATLYWRAIHRTDGRLDVVLDPAYLRGSSLELDSRILAHLGVANVTDRQFALENPTESSISLDDVLYAVEADYQAARVEGSRRAPLLLAALAEASRVAGLHSRAERAYLEFQSRYLDSAYGFRDLGILYREQGRLAEGQAMLERAVEVSPRDIDSRLNLARVYLDQGMWGEAEQTLDAIMAQSLTTLFHSRLFDPDIHATWARLHQGRGDLAQAIDARRRVAMIGGAPADHLALASLYRQQGQPQQTAEQCAKAARALLRTWPRPLDPQLWQIGVCMAQSDADIGDLDRVLSGQTQWLQRLFFIGLKANYDQTFELLAKKQPLIGNVLLGHAYRARGELDQALVAYHRAAEERPDEGAPHYFLGETYQALGQPEAAEAEYRRAAELDPLESLPLLTLGRMQWASGQHEAALETFRAAVETTPGWGQAHVALGNALLALGDGESAAEHYRLAQIADGDIHDGVVYDFAAHLAEADVQSPDADYVRNDYFAIDGDQRRMVFAHPDSRVSYVVDIPEKPGLWLAFDVVTSPESWELPGDGVAFAVYIEPGEDTQHETRNTGQVFSTYIDPKQNPDDRRWHSHAVDLSAYAGQTVTITFETGTGPAGDYQYDWAGWGSPRLLRR